MATPIQLQDFTPVLKSVYLPFRKKIFPVMTVLLAQARKVGPETVTYSGNDLFFDVKVERRAGFVASARGFFPNAKIAREKQGRLSVARMYAMVSVDGFALKASASDKGSFIPAAKKVVEDVMDQWEIEQNRVLHSDSLGIRATVTSGANSASQTAANPYGITGAGPGNLHLVDGEDVAFLDSTGTTLRGKRMILSHSLSGDTVTLTLDSAVNTSTGDLIVSCVPTSVDPNDTSFGAEPHGIKSIVDVEAAFATFEGLNDPRWAATQLSSTTVDETIVMRLLNQLRARSGVDWRKNSKAMLLLTTTGIWQAYGESLLGIRRFSAPVMELNGGFTGVQVAGATLIDDPWAPRGRIYAIHGPDTIFVDLMDFGEISFQDSPRWRLAANQDAFEAVFASYWNYGTLVRTANGVIFNITDTVNYSPVFA
jgi:hypothetical protein